MLSINRLLIDCRLKFNLLCLPCNIRVDYTFQARAIVTIISTKNLYMRINLRIVGLLFSFITLAASAQEPTVGFRIINKKNEAVAFATVSVQSVTDSTQKKQRVTDSLGRIGFKLTPDNYTVRVQAVNYEAYEKGITVKANNAGFTITLETQSQTLGAVTVVSRKPLMRQEDDKTIVDPENLAASSTNAYEIIEKTPGLFVDQDGNIYLTSTTPATIYINGREQKMSAADVAAMLKSLPPNSIASIEILRTPSARYDASGGGGIVNVILKKNVRIGLTGSLNAGMNQGRYGNQFIGFNLNNNNGNLTTYLNVQYSRRKTYDQINTDDITAVDSLTHQSTFTLYPTQSMYAGYGFSYQFNKKWDLSFDGRVNRNTSQNNSFSVDPTITKKISTGQILSSNDNDTKNDASSWGFSNGVSLKYKIDSLGSEWSTDVNYNYAPNQTEQRFTTNFTAPFTFSRSSLGDFDNKLHFVSAQTNFIKKFKGLTLETGIKTTGVWFNNKTDYFNTSSGSAVKDAFRSKQYEYKENIHAGYLQASKNFSGIVIKAGVRVENTNMNGRQLSPKDTSFSQKRTDAFPYIYLSRNLMKIAGYDLRAYLVYRKTINRPSYEALNPAVRLVNDFLTESGNPSLRPQFTNNYEANISFEERPILAIGYNDTKDIFSQVVIADTGNKRIRTFQNLGTNKETYFRALGAVPPGKKYFFVAGFQYNHNFYNGFYGSKPASFKRGSWSVFTYHTYKAGKNTQLQLNGFARFAGQQQFYELGSFGSLNFSITQQLLNKKLTVTASVNDIFFTNNNEFTINQQTLKATGYRESDTRRFGLNLRYNFGFRKKEENNMFNIESPENKN
jgi:iron complex outermembrane receptor protein